MRIRFGKGNQKKFMNLVLNKIGCPSLKELINRGIDVNYTSLRNYYGERRLLPEELFKELLEIAGLDKMEFKVEILNDTWGNSKGGKKSRK